MRDETCGSSDVALAVDGGRKPTVAMTLPGAICRRATWGKKKGVKVGFQEVKKERRCCGQRKRVNQH